MRTTGIHHVTAIAGEPQRNLDFYAGALGVRLVKRTVNFDDPTTYHLYFGDATGRPGSILTFFPWAGARAGRHGHGQVGVTSLAIPTASIGYWIQRLISKGIEYTGPDQRFGEPAIAFPDPDGLTLELVGSDRASKMPAWSGGPVPAEHAIRGLHAVNMWEEGHAATTDFLTGVMGFRSAGEEGSVRRFATGDGGPGALVDVRDTTGFWKGTMGAGAVHHVAWRAADAESQLAMRAEIVAAGVSATPVIDRQYFHSVYFNEPGGVLFEIATDGPGFAIDESPEELGHALKLPPWIEPRRASLEEVLPPLHMPGAHPFSGDVANE
ncbi:MAG: ring-cleaving dioxygenase [Gemmatimonadota bacterium]|nr:ring-cleaving dioxygenase [Gemmatimonadota bacterium]